MANSRGLTGAMPISETTWPGRVRLGVALDAVGVSRGSASQRAAAPTAVEKCSTRPKSYASPASRPGRSRATSKRAGASQEAKLRMRPALGSEYRPGQQKLDSHPSRIATAGGASLRAAASRVSEESRWARSDSRLLSRRGVFTVQRRARRRLGWTVPPSHRIGRHVVTGGLLAPQPRRGRRGRRRRIDRARWEP